jgi:hypothetical protein
MRRCLALLLLVLLGAPAAARAQDTVVAYPGAGTAIRSFGGWAAWQQVDFAHARYVLVVRAPDGTLTVRPETAPLHDALNPVPEAIPFDLGPDAANRPTLVVGACSAPGSCSLRIARLPGGAERELAGTAQRALPRSVTLWRGAVAWTDASGRVWLRDRSRAHVVHPWASRQCAEDVLQGPRCIRPKLSVDELELRGRLLASVVHYFVPGQAGFVTSRVGLYNTRTRHRTSEDVVTAGEGGQTFLAPAFPDARHVEWLLTCTGDPGGCSPRFGIYRRDLRTGTVRFASDAQQRDGWAPLDATHALLGPGKDGCLLAQEGSRPVTACTIVSRPLRFGAPPRG